jgi:hypothetical protein
MYSALSFDELNQMDMNTRSIPYEKYFGEMELPKEEKETRIKLAENMEDEFLYVMSLMFTLQKYPTPNWETARQEFFDRYKKSLNGYVAPNENFLAYMTALSYEVIDATKRNIDDPYYFSQDRAKFISENESNVSRSFQYDLEAIAQGKTKKQWVAIMDKKTRSTHRSADGEIIGITEPFIVGGSLLMYPRDVSLGASSSEIVGCRCSVKYI